MKESNPLKAIAYSLLVIIPFFLILGISYLVALANDETMLTAETIYETDTFQNLYRSEWYDMGRDINFIVQKREMPDGYKQYKTIQNENELLDFAIVDHANQNIFSNLDFDAWQEETEIAPYFQADDNVYVIYQNGETISNQENLKVSWDGFLSPVYYLLLQEGFQQPEKKSFSQSSDASEDNMIEEGVEEEGIIEEGVTGEGVAEENIAIEKIAQEDVIIYTQLREQNRSVSFWLYSRCYEVAKALGRSPTMWVVVLGVLWLLLFGYVMVAAGHKEGVDGIAMNTLDRLPYDLYTGILLVFLLAMIAFWGNLFGNLSMNMNMTMFSLLVVGLVFTLLLFASFFFLWFISGVKRVKAKTFWKNQLFVIVARKVGKGVWRILKAIWNVLLQFWYHLAVNLRILLSLVAITGATIFCLVKLDGGEACVCLFLLWGVVLFLTIRKVSKLKQVEKALEKIYQGDMEISLDETVFSGDLKKISHYINDISNGFRHAIDQGIKSERMKAELITNVSHDLKTPLTSIINYVDLLKKEDIQNQKAKEYIEILESKSQRLKRLTEDLVEASKASSGNLSLTMTKINVEELLQQSIGEFQDKFEQNQLEIILQIKKKKMPKVDRLTTNGKGVAALEAIGKIETIDKAENLQIMADSRYLYRVIENLFSNLCKYALSGSRVYISLEEKETSVNLEIKNISKDRLNVSEEELMQRFVRGDKARTTEGSGLGLAIAKSLTELQKGTFAIQIDGDLFKVILQFPLI